jgi:guanylate kinase
MSKIQALFPKMRYMVSATTRTKRDGEVEGVTYYYLSPEEFEKRISNGDFFEYEEVHGNYYGTLCSELRQVCDVMGDIDVKGAKRIKAMYTDRVVTIFIMPPSPEELRARLQSRGEAEDNIQKRLERIEMELEASKGFDYVVENDSLDEAVKEVSQIVRGASKGLVL